MDTHRISGGKITLIDKRILCIVWDADHEVTVDDIKEVTRVREELIGNNTYCSLIDVTKDFLNFSSEAKTFVARNEDINRLRKAEALLVRNKAQQLGVDLYVRLFKPKSKTRIFTNKEKAIEWLHAQIELL